MLKMERLLKLQEKFNKICRVNKKKSIIILSKFVWFNAAYLKQNFDLTFLFS